MLEDKFKISRVIDMVTTPGCPLIIYPRLGTEWKNCGVDKTSLMTSFSEEFRRIVGDIFAVGAGGVDTQWKEEIPVGRLYPQQGNSIATLSFQQYFYQPNYLYKTIDEATIGFMVLLVLVIEFLFKTNNS